MHKVELVAPAPPSIMIKLWYCDITGRSIIVAERKRSHAISTRSRPSYAFYTRISESVLLHFKQGDINQNLVETSLSPRLWESDCYTNNRCWGPTNLQIT